MNPIRYFDEHRPNVGKILGAAIIGFAVLVMAASYARAGGSGCGVQLHGAHAMGELNGGGPVGLSSTGLMAGGDVFCDLAIGKSAFVVGVFGGASQAFGDFETIGLNYSLSAGMRAGVNIGSAMPYVHAGWTRIDVDTIGHVDGWKWGPGVQIAIDSNWAVDMRYEIADLDVGKWAPGVDAQTRAFRLGLVWQFGGGKQVESIFAPEVSQPACDPKLASCKKR